MPISSAGEDRLESWKQISAFLGCDERTAMRWEKVGLPVRRIPGHKRSRVYASRTEISKWSSQSLDPAAGITPDANLPMDIKVEAPQGVSPRSLSKVHLITGIAVCALGMLILGVIARNLLRPGLPAGVRFTENAVEALDNGGGPLWKHAFVHALDFSALTWAKPAVSDFVRIGDLRGDGGREVLVVTPVKSGPNPSDPPIVEVDCFSSRGTLLWSYVPVDTFRFGDHELKGPWLIFDVMISHDGQKKSIWVVVTHRVWGNSFVVQLDPQTGRGPIRFVNTGSLFKLHELRTGNRAFLLAAGYNNEYEMGSLAVIDEAKPFAASPQTSGTRHKCASCPAGDPDYYFVFPRSEINALTEQPLNAADGIDVDNNEIRVSKFELPRPSKTRTVYLLRLEPAVEVISLRYSSDYDLAHRDMERDGKITHSLANCPERLHPDPVRVWTPADGWKELSVKPNAP